MYRPKLNARFIRISAKKSEKVDVTLTWYLSILMAVSRNVVEAIAIT